MAFCLHPDYAEKFMAALRDGTINRDRLRNMTSEERRTFFAGIVGEDNAADVNAALEAKLLNQNQKQAFITWAKQTAGLTEPAKRDLLSRIDRMDKFLNPADEKAFLEDAVREKLGVKATLDETRQVSQLAAAATAARQTMETEDWNPRNGVAYGRALLDMRDYIESLKPDHQTLMNRLVDVLNVPKTALTSVLHLSAPFVQGWGMMSTARAWEAFGQMFRYFADEGNYRDLNAYIISHPDYGLAQAGKLGITNLGDKLSMREEALQSTLVQKASRYLSDKTGVPDLVRASSRAFTGYLNYVRFNRFVDLLNAARNAGEDVSTGSRVVRDLAKAVNDFTGRGAIGAGDRYASAAPALNALFFSPRKMSATMEMFDPLTFLDPRVSRTARVARVRQLVGSLLATSSVLGLAAAMGATIEANPIAQNFGKIQIGDEKLDITGGNAIYVRLLARLFAGQKVTAGGKLQTLGYGANPTTRADLVAQYLRGKLSPTAAAIVDALYGKDPVGRPFSVSEEVKQRLMPIPIQTFMDFAASDPKNIAMVLPVLSAIFGVGVESPIVRDLGLGHGPAEDELQRLNFSDYDLPKATGNPKIDSAVTRNLKSMVDASMTSFVQSPAYQGMSDVTKHEQLKAMLRGLNRAAVDQARAAAVQ